MPFQSEKQRRYLWANEPEIARDWTDTYGSRIQRDNGGTANYSMQGNVRNYLGEQEMVKAPLHWQSGPGHPQTQLAYITKPELDLILKKDLHGSLKKGPNPGPSGIMSLNDPATGRSGSEMSQAETTGSFGPDLAPTAESLGIRAGAVAAGAQPTTRDEIQAYNKSQWDQRFTPFNQRTTSRRGNQGLGFFKGLGNKFRDWAGKMRGGINPATGEYYTQREYEQNVQNRRNQKSLETILNRDVPWRAETLERLAELDPTRFGNLSEDQKKNLIGSTRTGRAIDRNVSMQDVLKERPFSANRLQEIKKGWDKQGINQPLYDEMTDDVALSKLRAGSDIDVMKGSVIDKKPFNLSSLNPNVSLSGIQKWLGDKTGYTQHNINNQLLKNALDARRITEKQYKLMGGYDVAQNMPLGKLDFINKGAPVGIASGVYQLAKKAAGWADKQGYIDDTMGMSKYGDIGAWGSLGLNTLGSQGLTPSNEQTYESIIGQYKPVGGMYPGGEHQLARGGFANLWPR